MAKASVILARMFAYCVQTTCFDGIETGICEMDSLFGTSGFQRLQRPGRRRFLAVCESVSCFYNRRGISMSRKFLGLVTLASFALAVSAISGTQAIGDWDDDDYCGGGGHYAAGCGYGGGYGCGYGGGSSYGCGCPTYSAPSYGCGYGGGYGGGYSHGCGCPTYSAPVYSAPSYSCCQPVVTCCQPQPSCCGSSYGCGGDSYGCGGYVGSGCYGGGCGVSGGYVDGGYSHGGGGVIIDGGQGGEQGPPPGPNGAGGPPQDPGPGGQNGIAPPGNAPPQNNGAAAPEAPKST